MSACTERLVSPCHHRPVSSVRPRICLVGRTMGPSQPQMAPTQRRCDRREDKKTKPNKRAFLTLPFGTIWQSFLLCTIQWATRSYRPDPVPGSFQEVSTHPIMNNRDHLGQLHHLIVWAIICNNKKTPRTNSNDNII